MAFGARDIEHYRREVAQDPDSLKFVPLAEALRRSGELDDAERVLQAGLEHHPKLRSARVVQARLWRDQGKRTRALTVLADLYPQDAGNVALTELYCELLIDLGHLDRAEEVLHRAQYTGVPDGTRSRLEAALEAARFPSDEIEDDGDLSSLTGVLTLPGLFLEELGDPFAVPVVAARVGRTGQRAAAKAIWREVARLHPAYSGRASREIARLDGIAGRTGVTAQPAIVPAPAAPADAARAIRAWATTLGLDV